MLFGKKKKKKEPAPAPKPIPLDYKTPKKDIKSVHTFTQSKGFKGFRRVRVSMGTSEDTVIDGKYYGTETFLMVHWPNMGPKVYVTVE